MKSRVPSTARHEWLELLGFVVFAIAAMLVAELPAAALGRRGDTLRAGPLLVAGIVLTALILPFVHWLQLRRGERLHDLGLVVPEEGWRKALALGAVAGIAIKIGTIFVALFVVTLGIRPTEVPFAISRSFDLPLFVLAGCVAAFVEEIVFRGYLPDRVARACGWSRTSWATGTVTSVLFSLGHGYQGLLGLVVTGFVGMALFAMLRSGTYTLVHCIVAHATFNTIAFLVVHATR